MKYGFIATADSHKRRPLCFMWDRPMNEEMKLSKLLHHLETKHSGFIKHTLYSWRNITRKLPIKLHKSGFTFTILFAM